MSILKTTKTGEYAQVTIQSVLKLGFKPVCNYKPGTLNRNFILDDFWININSVTENDIPVVSIKQWKSNNVIPIYPKWDDIKSTAELKEYLRNRGVNV